MNAKIALADPNLHGIDSMCIAHARAELSEVVGRACHGKSPTVLTSRDKPVAAIVPIEDLELIEKAIVPWEQVKAALDAKASKMRT